MRRALRGTSARNTRKALFYGTIDALTFAVPAMKLLLIEDNPTLAHWLAKMLEQEAFALDAVQDGDAADRLLQSNHYDVILLDLNLPKLSGKNVLRRLRQRGDATPVLILTASGSIDEKVELLGAGADDYLVKPFEVRELIARIKVAIRRQSPSKASEVVCGDLTFDIDTRQFTLKGAPLNVTPRERSVLETLILRLGKTVTKPALVDAIFTLADEPSEDAVETLHLAIAKSSTAVRRLSSLRGLGYLLRKKKKITSQFVGPLVMVVAGAACTVRARDRQGGLRQCEANRRSRAGQSAHFFRADDCRRSELVDGFLRVDALPAALEIFASPYRDQVFYSVIHVDGRHLLAGTPDFPPRPTQAADTPDHYDTTLYGQDVRAVGIVRLMHDNGATRRGARRYRRQDRAFAQTRWPSSYGNCNSCAADRNDRTGRFALVCIRRVDVRTASADEGEIEEVADPRSVATRTDSRGPFAY